MAKVSIRGPIIPNSHKWIYDWYEIEATCPKDVQNIVDKAAKHEAIDVEINSGGGSVFDGSEIYAILKSAKSDVNGKILGIAASAASFIAMACKNLEIAPTAQLMIHNASAYAEGNKNDMQKTSDFLSGIDKSIASAYMLKTGKTEAEILKLMNEETFFTADKALEHGFVDKIMFTDEIMAVASIESAGLLPKAVVDKMLLRVPEAIKVLETENTVIDKKVEGEDEMDYEKLKNEFPEIFNQIKNEGASEERLRIKNIEEISIGGFEDLVNKAKFEEPINAGELSLKILKAQKNQGDEHFEKVIEDAQKIESVKATMTDSDLKSVDIVKNETNSIVRFFKNKKGEK